MLNAFAALMGGVMPYITSFVLDGAGWNAYFALLCTLSVIVLGMFMMAGIREKKNKLSGEIEK